MHFLHNHHSYQATTFTKSDTPVDISYDDRIALLQLCRTENVGPISFFHLLGRYGTPQEALERLPSLRKNSDLRIPTYEDAQREMDAHEKRGFFLVSYYDVMYPHALRYLKDSPPFLSMGGNMEIFQQPLFAIVGSRSASHAGERIASEIAFDLSQKKWCLVSGMAKGIDACVHRASLENGTVAVVAGGIDYIYPLEHKKLYHDILAKGAVISEDPLGQQPYGALFPKRNRIISGLSWGVLIVEASLRSGSLMTAKYALDQGREVFAVPGHPLDIRSRGANKLIGEGAHLVEKSDDILQCYNTSPPLQAEESCDEFHFFAPSTDYESLYSSIEKALTFVPISVETLAQYVETSPIVVRIALVEMEINGSIERCPGDCVMKASAPSEKVFLPCAHQDDISTLLN